MKKNHQLRASIKHILFEIVTSPFARRFKVKVDLNYDGVKELIYHFPKTSDYGTYYNSRMNDEDRTFTLFRKDTKDYTACVKGRIHAVENMEATLITGKVYPTVRPYFMLFVGTPIFLMSDLWVFAEIRAGGAIIGNYLLLIAFALMTIYAFVWGFYERDQLLKVFLNEVKPLRKRK